MYEKFYGLKEKPFSILPDPGFLYWSQSHELAFAMLEYGVLSHAGFTVITGEVGCGKTTLLRHLLTRLGEDVTVGLMSNTPDNGRDLLEWILMAFGHPLEGKSAAALYDQFRQFMILNYSQGRRTLLIVDEAQNLGPQGLEDLRMLSNINADKDQLLQLILVGQPQLRELLRQPDMTQFAQRVSSDFHLQPLALDEMINYIAHRLAIAGAGHRRCFTFEACRRIHAKSGGVPRMVNILCDTAMVYGFARDVRVIPARIVDEVIKDKADHGVFGASYCAPDGLGRAIAGGSIERTRFVEPAGPASGSLAASRRDNEFLTLSSILRNGRS